MMTNRVKVEKIVNGGYGLGRLNNGQVILLHNSLEGEEVQYGILEKRKKILFGTAKSILSPNGHRLNPPCTYYNKCGGCNLQHCNYDGQLQIKNSIVKELLQIIPGSTWNLRPIIPSPLQLGYRQRIRLKIHSDKVGFLQFRSKEIIPIDICLLAHPAINRVLSEILETMEFSKLCAHGEEIELLYNPNTSLITCLLHYGRKPRPADRNSAITLVEKTDTLERLFFTGSCFSLEDPFGQTGNDCGSKSFSQQIHFDRTQNTCKLSWEIGGFCQVNIAQNHNLVNFVLQQCGDIATKVILDLFCGMGNFSIPLAMSAQSLLGIEGQGSAIRSARKNSLKAGLRNTVFTKGSIHQVCNELIKENKKFDIVILDPPRQGIPGLSAHVCSLTREKIIYISCDPATLARDLEILVNSGFRLTEVQPFDMFPQTHHVEAVAVLEKK